MDYATHDLGQRIVKAARLAVAAHLYQAVSNSEIPRQRVVIGGAGPYLPTDGVLSPAMDRPQRSSPNAERQVP